MNRQVFVIALLTCTAAFSQHGRPDSINNERSAPSLTEQDSDVDVIVKFKGEGNLGGHRGAGFSRRHGLNVRFNHELIGSHAYTLKKSELERFAGDPDIEFIALDQEVRPTLDRSRAAVMAKAAVSRTGVDGWQVTVAVIDSGIDATSEAFTDGTSSRVIFQKSFIPNVTSTADEYGHGTHVASIVGGDGMGTNTATASYKGLAPYANLINLRVLDKNGMGKDSYVIAALSWAVANKTTYDIRIINLSLGRPVTSSYKTDPLCLAVEAAWKAGIVVVVAAGNEGRNNSAANQGYGTISSPGNDPYVITVGAAKAGSTDSRADDMPTSYSSKGPSMIDHVVKPDLLAPGNKVVALGTGSLFSGNPGNVVDATNK